MAAGVILFPFKTSCQTTCHVFSRYNRGRECFGFWYGVSSHTSLNFSTQKRVCFFACVLETPETCSYLLLRSQIRNFQKPVRVALFLLAFSKLPETCSYLRLRSWIETQKRVRVGFFACVLKTIPETCSCWFLRLRSRNSKRACCTCALPRGSFLVSRAKNRCTERGLEEDACETTSENPTKLGWRMYRVYRKEWFCTTHRGTQRQTHRTLIIKTNFSSHENVI